MRSAGELSPTDIRDQLRQDHQTVFAELQALRHEVDDRSCQARLARLRRSWMVHTLAKETVVYHAIEGIESVDDSARADRRLVEHEWIESEFERLSRLRPGTLEWRARLDVARELITMVVETEREEAFAELAQRYDAVGLAELSRSFTSARAKLALLEEAKAA